MTDTPKPRLTLVDAVLAEQPAANAQAAAIERQILTKHAPSIAKRVRAEERASIFNAAGAQTIEDLALIPQIRLEHEAKLQAYETRWEREEQKHGRHRFWQGIAVGGVLAGLGWGAFQLYTFNAISDTIAQTTRQDVMTGAIVRAHSEGEQ